MYGGLRNSAGRVTLETYWGGNSCDGRRQADGTRRPLGTSASASRNVWRVRIRTRRWFTSAAGGAGGALSDRGNMTVVAFCLLRWLRAVVVGGGTCAPLATHAEDGRVSDECVDKTSSVLTRLWCAGYSGSERGLMGPKGRRKNQLSAPHSGFKDNERERAVCMEWRRGMEGLGEMRWGMRVRAVKEERCGIRAEVKQMGSGRGQGGERQIVQEGGTMCGERSGSVALSEGRYDGFEHLAIRT